MREIPAGAILEVYETAARSCTYHAAPSVPEFRAAWQKHLAAAPRETFQEAEIREAAAAGRPALPAPSSIPVFAQIFRSSGRCVVCKCQRLKSFKSDTTHTPAKIERDVRGRDVWVCALDLCGFEIDANDEKQVRENSVSPVFGVGTSPEKESVLTVGTSASRAQLLAEQCGVDWEDCDENQREFLRQMARWVDKNKISISPENFGARWEQFQTEAASAA